MSGDFWDKAISYRELRSRLRRYADEMKDSPTESEVILKDALDSLLPPAWNTSNKNSPIRFQAPVGHYYIADFYCSKAKLIFEVDGGCHDQPDIKEHDDFRTKKLVSLGYGVYRFSNDEIKSGALGIAWFILDRIWEIRPDLKKSFKYLWDKEL